MRRIPFVKMSGTGNDFILLDNRTGWLEEAAKAPLARAACPRRVSAGADGVILIEPAHIPAAQYRMRIFNADGSEAEMCGNGARCCAIFARQIEAAGEAQVIATLAGLLQATASADGQSAQVQLSAPSALQIHRAVTVLGEETTLYWMDTGVPHAIRYVDEAGRIDVKRQGAAIRHHAVFQPRGANANFVQLLGGNAIRLRTYERGVEDETFACGTGATACAVVTGLVHAYASPVHVHVASGDVLKIHFVLDRERQTSSRPVLEGAVRTVYRGEFFWDEA